MRGPVAMATGRLVLHSGRSGHEEMGFEGGNGWICDHRGSLKFQGLRGGQREGGDIPLFSSAGSYGGCLQKSLTGSFPGKEGEGRKDGGRELEEVRERWKEAEKRGRWKGM